MKCCYCGTAIGVHNWLRQDRKNKHRIHAVCSGEAQRRAVKKRQKIHPDEVRNASVRRVSRVLKNGDEKGIAGFVRLGRTCV